MPHMLLIVEPVGQRAERTEEEGRALYDSMMRFGADLQARGLLIASESLHSTATGARVETREGRTTVVDGPFAEAKEMVGGFFLLATDNRQEAIDIARACPAATWSTVEVRGVGPCFEKG
ncbi:MAG: YciI family protein [Pseudomonadota bacterium]